MKVYKFCFWLIFSIVISSCENKSAFRQSMGMTWGTQYHITYKSEADLSDSIVAVMRAIDMSLSPFEQNSLVARINAGDTTVVADAMLRDVFDVSHRVHKLSNGAFDPTVAPLINLWGFGYRQGADDTPEQAQIDSCLTTVGFGYCGIDKHGHVYRKHAHTEFNFSAVAKGYGVDCVAAMLQRNGCTDYMVEIGGEVALSGDGPRGDGWTIQIDTPIDDAKGEVHEQMRLLHTTGVGIATSGSYRNFRDTSQGRVSHTINAVTGQPVTTGTVSVTVIAPTTALADALATAAMAMQPDSALTMLCGIEGVEALLVNSLNDTIVLSTPGFDSYTRR